MFWIRLGTTLMDDLQEGMIANQLYRIVVGISSQFGRDDHFEKLCRFDGGYRDSLLETVQEAPTICYQGMPR